MNSKDRFVSALYLETPDCVPIGELLINDLIIDKILGTNSGNISSAERNAKCYKKLDLDMVPTFLDGLIFPESSASPGGETVDAVGRRYTWDERTQTWWYRSGAVKTLEDLERYSLDASQEELYETTKRTIENVGDDLAVVGVLDNTEMTSQSMGYDRFCLAFYKDIRLVEKSLDVRTDFVINAAKRMVELGVDAIISCDDIADKHGPMISPTHYKEHVFPRHKRFTEEVGKDVPILIHSDGNLWPLLDLFRDAGFDGIHSMEPIAGMDIRKVKERYGDDWCLMGNVDCSYTLCLKSTEEVIEETMYCIDSAAPGGGYIMSSSNTLHNAINIDNYLTMIRTTRKYGRYPTKG